MVKSVEKLGEKAHDKKYVIGEYLALSFLNLRYFSPWVLVSNGKGNNARQCDETIQRERHCLARCLVFVREGIKSACFRVTRAKPRKNIQNLLQHNVLELANSQPGKQR